jgi:hypothetical protein
MLWVGIKLKAISLQEPESNLGKSDVFLKYGALSLSE